MREPLAVAAAQPHCSSHDPAANAVAHAAAIRAAGARVVVFPELSLTGYELDAEAIDVDDPRLAPIVEACADTGSLALLGAPVHNGAGRSIGVLLIEADRIEVAYRKMWLGGNERDRFVPGSAPAALDVDGWRLGLAVCKDTGIPQHAAETAGLGVDVYVAGVLEHAEDAAVLEQRARRIVDTHDVWVVVASFAGSTGGGFRNAAGGSAIWNPDGDVVARAGPEPGEIVRAVLTDRLARTARPAAATRPEVRLPDTAHNSRPWRIHELTGDFRLEDVWALPTPGGRDDFPRLVRLMASFDAARSSSGAVRTLFAIRWKIGELLGLDRPETGLGSRVPTLRHRLPADLRNAPTGPRSDEFLFTPLYLTDDEWALEVANQTVHGVLHLGWVPDGTGGYRGQMAVLVKPNGLLGSVYMAAIAPFRHLVVYPRMMRDIGRAWQERTSRALA